MEVASRFKRAKVLEVEDLIAYSERKLWKPHYPKDLVRRFLTELISSDEMIIDLHDSKGRLAAAVLLDCVNNSANDACLEILGIRDLAMVNAVLPEIVKIVRELSPPRRSGFQVALHESSHEACEILHRLGLVKYYDTYEMKGDCSNQSFDSHEDIRPAAVADADQVYVVLCESFAKSPDASIPDFSIWKKRFLSSAESHFYVCLVESTIVGFANLIEDREQNETELRTVGVLERFRGQGLGRRLVKHCLAESRRLSFEVCRLTVAVRNQRALDLYLEAGFKTFEKLICLRSNFARQTLKSCPGKI